MDVGRAAQVVPACQPSCEKMEREKKIKRKWRENEDMERKWTEDEEMERDLLSTFPHFYQTRVQSLFTLVTN